jgi:hypothetical protein
MNRSVVSRFSSPASRRAANENNLPENKSGKKAGRSSRQNQTDRESAVAAERKSPFAANKLRIV